MFKNFISFLLLGMFCISCNESNSDTVKITADSIEQKTVEQDTINLMQKDTMPYHVYLTFDDGPLEGSQHVNRVITEEKIPASVFVVGKHNAANDQMKEYLHNYRENPYLDVYNHSYTHANGRYKLFYSNPVTAAADIVKNEEDLDLKYKIVRLPGRNMWRIQGQSKNDGASGKSTADTLAKMGFTLVGWDVEWSQKNGQLQQTAEQMLHMVEEKATSDKAFKKGEVVILLHDQMFTTKAHADELQKFIQAVKAKGNYSFQTLRYYLEY